MRQIVLDTETTGLEAAAGHRIIEIGCIELINRRATQNRFHRYVNPERDIDEGALAVHGITRAQLEKEPRFAEVAADLLEFLGDAELIIHNAGFDLGFLDAEFARAKLSVARFAEGRRVIDSLTLARELHPGQRNNLDALCKRYSVDNSRRELHGALLDAQLLAEVYLAMTGGQAALALGDARAASVTQDVSIGGAQRVERPTHLRVIKAGAEELAAHEVLLCKIDKAAGKPALWRAAETPG
jgi:DNA polymerase-3 subunit epsilon